MNSPLAGGVQAWKRAALAVLAGCVALSIGLLVYLADRVASHALLIPAMPLFSGRNLFGVLGQWLPSFVHPLAFSLFTAVILKPGVGARWGACLFWASVNVAFEVGQHPALSALWTAALHGGAGDSTVLRSVLHYFVQGTFDPYDICAAMLGALAAGVFLHFVSHFGGAHGATN